jgi:hypothetical protein
MIGFILHGHGMMGSREHCASLAHFQMQKIPLNKLKRFIKINAVKKNFLYKQTFAGLLKGNPSDQLLRPCSSIRFSKCSLAVAGNLLGQCPDK